MGLIVNVTDFENAGRYSLPVGNEFSDPRATAIITQKEPVYLMELLGVTLFDLFKTAYIADPTWASPANLKYKVIYDAIAQNDNGCIRQNNGMKEMLMGFLYFEIARVLPVSQTISGAVRTPGDVAQFVNPTQADLYGRYNEGKRAADVIQWYIEKNSTDYPDYNGQCFKIASPY